MDPYDDGTRLVCGRFEDDPTSTPYDEWGMRIKTGQPIEYVLRMILRDWAIRNHASEGEYELHAYLPNGVEVQPRASTADIDATALKSLTYRVVRKEDREAWTQDAKV